LQRTSPYTSWKGTFKLIHLIKNWAKDFKIRITFKIPSYNSIGKRRPQHHIICSKHFRLIRYELENFHLLVYEVTIWGKETVSCGTNTSIKSPLEWKDKDSLAILSDTFVLCNEVQTPKKGVQLTILMLYIIYCINTISDLSNNHKSQNYNISHL